MGSIVLVVVGITYYVIAKNVDKPKTQSTQNPVVNFNNQGDGVRYNEDEGSIELYDSQSDGYKKIASVDTEPAYSEISTDQKYLLYTTEASDSYEGEENLSVIDITSSSEILSAENIYSPRFLPNGKVVYQLVGENSSALKISDHTGTAQTVALPTNEQVVIEPINENYLIAYEFSYDAGESTSYLVNIVNNTSSEFASGEGLKIKTVLNSQYTAVQTIAGEKTSVRIVSWKSKQTIRNIDGIALDDLDWQQDTHFVYAKSGVVYKSSFDSPADTEIAKAPNPIVQLKLIAPNKLFMTSTEKSYTTTF